jgi:tetratricopeptide (TPR) repeat protein
VATPDSLQFISEEVIERLKTGRFVATRESGSRRAHPSAEEGHSLQDKRATPRNTLSDRRKSSPLSIIKRCIRYEPLVFKYRLPQVMQLIEALNHPTRKIILVGAEQGQGKTSLARAVLEPMGGGLEQVLWFEVNRHTDFEEVNHFLLRTIQQLFADTPADSSSMPGSLPFERRADRERNKSADSPRSSAGGDPLLLQLEKQLNAVRHTPLLLVLDNIEFLVDSSLRLNSAPFKDVLNFLLDFPNIKMLFLGERLPYADMIPNEDSILDLRLSGLNTQDAIDWLRQAQTPKAADSALLEEAAFAEPHSEEQELEAISGLVQKSHGSPWILKTILRLQHATRLPYPTLNALLTVSENHPPTGQAPAIARLLTQLIEERLPDQQRALLYLLAFIRHPVNLSSLQAMVGSCYPALTSERLNSQALEAMLDHSLLRCLLRISYPPQEVLAHVRQSGQSLPGGKSHPEKFQPGYELQLGLKQIISQRVPAAEKERLHTCLRDLYIRERGLESQGRILRIKNRALLSEARYHSAAVREPNQEQQPQQQALQNQLPRPVGGTPSRSGQSAPPPLLRSTPPYTAPFRAAPYSQGQEKQEWNQPAIPKTFNDELGGLSPQRKSLEAQSIIPLDIEPLWPESFSEHEEADADTVNRSPFHTEKGDSPLAGSATQSENSLLADTIPPSAPPHGQWKSLQASLGKQTAHHQADQQEKELHRQLENALAAHDPKILAHTLLELSRFRFGRGQAKSALPLLESALSLKADLPKDLQAELYQLQGSVLKSLYQHNAALKALTFAAGLVRTLIYGDDTVSGIWFARLGRIYQDFGDIHAYRAENDTAQTAYTEALRWYRSAKEDTLAAEVHFQLAGLAEERDDMDTAILHYEKAIAFNKADGNTEGQYNPLSAAAALSNLGNLHLDAQRYPEAEGCFEQALIQDRAAENIAGQLNTLACLFDLYFQQDSIVAAERRAQEGLALAIRECRPFWQASFYLKLCEIAERRQQWPQALRQAQLALSCGETELSADSKHWLKGKIQTLSLQFSGQNSPHQ